MNLGRGMLENDHAWPDVIVLMTQKSVIEAAQTCRKRSSRAPTRSAWAGVVSRGLRLIASTRRLVRKRWFAKGCTASTPVSSEVPARSVGASFPSAVRAIPSELWFLLTGLTPILGEKTRVTTCSFRNGVIQLVAKQG